MSGIPWNVWFSWWLRQNVVGFTIDPSTWPLLLSLFAFLGLLLICFAWQRTR